MFDAASRRFLLLLLIHLCFVGHGGQSASGNAGNHNALAYNSATVTLTITAKTTIYLKLSNGINVSSISQPADYGSSDLGRAWVIVRKYQ